MGTATSRAAARRLRRTRQRLGGYRHDLLVAMRVVNGIEMEMLQSEWENWLMDENARCEQARDMLLNMGGEAGKGEELPPVDGVQQENNGGGQKVMSSDDDQERQQQSTRREALQKWYGEYCGSCEADQRALFAGRKASSFI